MEDTSAEDPSGQAEFVGRLALVLAVLAVLAGVTVMVRSATFYPTSGENHVDQAGSTNPAALPSPQTAKPTVANPNAAPSPAPQTGAGGASPAAQANQQPATPAK